MSKNLETSILLDLYGTLLTKKQYDIMDLYYNDDFSLGEIAQQYGISRQGVHDTIKRGDETITDYENKLGLYASQKSYVNELKEFKKQALDIFDECKRKNYAKDIAEKAIVLLENLDSKLEEYDNSEYIYKDLLQED